MQLFSRFLHAIHFVFQNTSRLISRRYFSRAKILSDDVIMLVSDSFGESRRRSDERRLQIYQHLSSCTSNARHDAENNKCLIRILRLKHDSIPRSDGQLIFEHNVETAIPGIWKDLKVLLTDIRVSMAQENQASMMRQCTTVTAQQAGLQLTAIHFKKDASLSAGALISRILSTGETFTSLG